MKPHHKLIATLFPHPLLRRVEIEGFKTFFHREVIEPATMRTGICGPGGSGKTNVIQAILWCLGEKLEKTMKRRKIEEDWDKNVINHRSSHAYVKLTFDNSTGIFPLRRRIIEIERRFGRDGKKDYFLNGRRSDLVRYLHLWKLKKLEKDAPIWKGACPRSITLIDNYGSPDRIAHVIIPEMFEVLRLRIGKINTWIDLSLRKDQCLITARDMHTLGKGKIYRIISDSQPRLTQI